MTTQTEVPKLLISKREAAQALGGLSIRTIENFIRRKELLVRKVGRRTLVVASSLQSFVRRDHESPSPSKRSAANEAKAGRGQDAVL